ncbi:winged helix-turn-helix transcriptional regulator [Mycobacterium sp.]|jgi:DNA-binding HxlR family transcriptional regulator|uniref:winged helix-turn-helix transcriptional regulator n=1 Tax=Mycobacterium sp. TaxID=1785 RepID=UPI003F9E35D0
MPEGRLQRDCSVFRTVAAVGDAWSWLVLREALFSGVTRFDEFQNRLGIARSTLAARLDKLVASQLLRRDGADYLPTEQGNDFLGSLLTAMHWGDRWCGDSNQPPVMVKHLTCGAKMHTDMSCDHCGKPVAAREVTFDRVPQPAHRPKGQPTRTRMPGLNLLERQRPCSIARTLQVIGEQWSSLIIQECFFGTHRFDAFQNRLAIASNILSQRLARLTDLGVLTNRSADDRRGYHLTDKGLDLYPVALAMLMWGDRWLSNGRPPIALTHTTCAHRLRAVPTCSRCGTPILLCELEIGV